MESIKMNFVIVCESAVVDKYTNNLYLLGIFSNINTKGVPTAHPAFNVVTNFSGEGGEHVHKIVISYEDGTEIGRLEEKINFGSGANRNTQFIGRFMGFPFPKYGLYNVRVYIDEEEQLLKARINVVKQES